MSYNVLYVLRLTPNLRTTIAEIVHRVREGGHSGQSQAQGQRGPMRPRLECLDFQIVRDGEHCIKKCMADCWLEEAGLRPSLVQVTLCLRVLLCKMLVAEATTVVGH